MIVPWEPIDSFVAADRQFVSTVRDVAARLRAAGPRMPDLKDWLVLRVPDIERDHQQIIVAQAELRSPAHGQSMEWLLLRIHQLTGGRQTLGASYSTDWNRRISDLVSAVAPELAVELEEAASAVSAAATEQNRVCTERSRARKTDRFRGRKMYAENHHWFWERRDESWNYHMWKGVAVPIAAPNRAAATFFSGDADGYVLPHSVPMSLRSSSASRCVSWAYGSLFGTAEERRRQFADVLDRTRDERAVLGAELYQGSLPLLSNDEGIFGAWWLTKQQYSKLQKLCEAHGWPTDLWVESVPWWRHRPS